MKWQSRKTTIPRKVMPQEKVSQNNNGSTDEETAEQALLLTGLMLRQLSCIAQLVVSLEQVVQSNLATPKTEEAWLYALSETVNLTTNMCDQLRMLALISNPLSLTSPSKAEITWTVDKGTEFLDEIVETFDLE